ncbi:MAG: hypothetical protein PUA94_07975 [Bacteroidales bacterium]|nr:hypothetical protein [Bacteroidales bacterium]
MNNLYKKLTICILLSSFVLVVSSCGGSGKVWKKLDQAEHLMEAKPDSALAILDNIKLSTLKNGEESARYALLKSIALDKNCIDTTTFDIINPAIGYYLQHGSAHEKFLTYYYCGRIYQNQGNEDSAMEQFMNAADLKNEIKDSTLLAHNLVAMGSLYFKQYKISKFIETNMDAAEIYGRIGKRILEIKSYTNAIDGYIMMHDKAAADSVLSVCMPLVHDYPESEGFVFSSLLSYIIEFGTSEEIANFLNEYQNLELEQDDALNFAQGYSKIGKFEKAINIISDIKIEGTVLDSLKYISVKTGIYEKQGDYQRALSLFREYSAMLERYQKHLLSQDLLFADERHQLEMTNLIELQNRDRIIWGILCGSFALFLLVGWFYYRYRLLRSKRLIAEKDNDNLRLEQENLRREKENAELERDKKTLEAQNLEKERKRLVAEQHLRELEAANLILEKKQLEGERDNLRDLLKEQTELSKPIQEIIKMRLDMLNSLLAKEITNNESYAKPYNKWIESIRNDKSEFMNSTRLAFTASHPRFIEYLEQHGLSIDEINYICLYAIGLRGKEVGEYIQLKRHYNISSDIRKKLGIDEHETNIGLYIRKRMNEL